MFIKNIFAEKITFFIIKNLSVYYDYIRVLDITIVYTIQAVSPTAYIINKLFHIVMKIYE